MNTIVLRHPSNEAERDPIENFLDLLFLLRIDSHHEPALRFTEEKIIVSIDILFRNSFQFDLQPQATGDGGLGETDPETPIRAIVARPKQSRLRQSGNLLIDHSPGSCVNGWDILSDKAVVGVILGPSQLRPCHADNVDQVAGLLYIHSNRFRHIIDPSQSREEKRWRDRYLVGRDTIVVFHAVLSRYESYVIRGTVIFDSHVCPYELRELVMPVRCFLRLYWVRPAEIVQPGDVSKFSPHRDDVSHCFIDAAGCHVIGVDVAVSRDDAIGYDDTDINIQDRPHNSPIGRAIAVPADERLHHTSTLYFMIVLPDPGFFTADIESADHLLQHLTAVIGRREVGLLVYRLLPPGGEFHPGSTIVKKIHVQVTYGSAAEKDMKTTAVGVRTEHG